MTKRKHLKRRIRERSAKTGESYTAARRHLRVPTEETTTMTATETRKYDLACSFCRKHTEAVKKLIAGPGVYICDECIDLCNAIIGEDVATSESAEKRAPSLDDGPVERLLAIFAGMAETTRSMDQNLKDWAVRLHERGVTTARLGAAAGLTAAEAQERFGI